MNGEAYEQADNARKYFTACLLAFYQQLWLWSTHRDKLTDFNIEKPLWVFVGNTVSGEESDILEVVNFLADFLNNDAQIKTWLTDLIADRTQILDAKGNNIFKGRFTPLMAFTDQVDALYADILVRVFNAHAKQRLKLVNIKSSKGELALRVGDAEPFGLINIGDDAGFFGLAEASDGFDSERDDFGGALFGTLNNKDSQLNVLIGSLLSMASGSLCLRTIEPPSLMRPIRRAYVSPSSTDGRVVPRLNLPLTHSLPAEFWRAKRWPKRHQCNCLEGHHGLSVLA